MFDFHLLFSASLFHRLLLVDHFKSWYFSDIVEFILLRLLPAIEVYHFCADENGHLYHFVGNPLDKHLYLDEGLYRRIKAIHSDLDFYSMAQFIRFVVAVFLNLVDAYGFEGALVEIDKANRQIALEYKKNPQKRINRLSFSPSSRQMSGELAYVIGYNQESRPLWVEIRHKPGGILLE